jgi:hypothetical protein
MAAILDGVTTTCMLGSTGLKENGKGFSMRGKNHFHCRNYYAETIRRAGKLHGDGDKFFYLFA